MRASILAAALSMSAIAMAQTPPASASKSRTPANLVLPVAGAPLAAEITEERTTKLPDGTSKTTILTSKVFRAADGRTRTESTDGPDGESKQIVTIMDRANGFMALLVPSQNFAGRFQFPKQDISMPGVLAVLGGPLITFPGPKTTKSEDLGKQTIDGIEYHGSRTITTSDEQPSLVGTYEFWYARDLGLIALTKSSGPDEQTTAKLHILDRNPPDLELFKIPTNYYVQEIKDDAPTQ